MRDCRGNSKGQIRTNRCQIATPSVGNIDLLDEETEQSRTTPETILEWLGNLTISLGTTK